MNQNRKLKTMIMPKHPKEQLHNMINITSTETKPYKTVTDKEQNKQKSKPETL